MSRKPIGVTTLSNTWIVVVCDDGSIWTEADQGDGWDEDKPIPGSQRAVEHYLQAASDTEDQKP